MKDQGGAGCLQGTEQSAKNSDNGQDLLAGYGMVC